MRRKIQAILEEIRPALQADGGDVEFVDYADGIVQVKLTGACSGCPMSTWTLKAGIENRLRKELPEIKAVEQVF
ncbi:MAG: NifU family protein [Bradymonadales bacterium]|nr:NifU family protein [Bradymonadales bacterium]